MNYLELAYEGLKDRARVAELGRHQVSDILPCPFCGSRAELVQVEEQNGAVVECVGCHASGPLRIHAKEDANPHAIYSWNCRAL